MKAISVDFNTLNSAPIGLVKIAGPQSDRVLPPLEQGERVRLVDSDLEAEGAILIREDGWIMACPDEETFRDIPLTEEQLRRYGLSS
jgi:hypothetical protein